MPLITCGWGMIGLKHGKRGSLTLQCSFLRDEVTTMRYQAAVGIAGGRVGLGWIDAYLLA